MMWNAKAITSARGGNLEYRKSNEEKTMATFIVPAVAPNPDSWGPPVTNDDGNPNAPVTSETDTSNISKYADLPYAPFGRSDRLGRAADFAGRGGNNPMGGGVFHQGRDHYRDGNRRNDGRNDRQGGGGGRGGGGGYGRGGDRGYGGGFGKIDEEAEEVFQLVDTSKTATAKRFVTPAARRRQHSARLRQVNARRQQSTTVSLSKETLQRGGGGGRGAAGRGGRGAGRGGRGRGNRFNNRVDRSPSVAVQADWVKVEEIDLAKLTKHLVASTDVPNPDDILWCGFLDQYNDGYDKITARQPQPLKRMEHKEFYPVTTTDDPVLEKLAIDGMGQVFVTDTILAHLMTCTRSVYPWDLVIQKLPGSGILFLDKRDNSQLDYLTVHETSYNPPTAEEGVNTPERLGLEATMINQNFSQQILKKTGRKEMDMPNPFFDADDAEEGMEPSSVAFRYRKFKLDDKTTLVCRTELHGLVKKTQYMTAFALNEYTPLPASTGAGKDANNNNQNNSNATSLGPNWREKIDSQRGAVLANELKNNSFKLAKWTAQSLLASADQMKIGFCSRVAPKNPYEHVILATQFYRPKDFATQITLSEGQMWSMMRMFVQLFQKQPEGKYVLMREPNKAVLMLYKVPQETFEDD
jgi:translation initiation factor 3 subunit D